MSSLTMWVAGYLAFGLFLQWGLQAMMRRKASPVHWRWGMFATCVFLWPIPLVAGLWSCWYLWKRSKDPRELDAAADRLKNLADALCDLEEKTRDDR